jgi:hypothetical protein
MTQRPATSMPGSSENSLLQGARRGDLQAFRQLVHLHQAEVTGLALQLAGEQPAALDLALDVLVRLHTALARIASPAHLRHWLLRTVSQRAFELGYKLVELQPVAGAQDPGEDFTTRVMAHVELRWSHRRADFATKGRRRTHSHRYAIFVSGVAILAFAALALWWPGHSRKPPVPPAVATHPASEAPQAAVPPGSPTSQAATAASRNASPLDAFPHYTLIVLPVRDASTDAGAAGAVQAFHAALVAELRKDPSITLLVPGVTAPPDMPQSADHVLTISRLETHTLPSGGTAFRITDSRGGSLTAGSSASGPQWPVEIRIRPVRQARSAGFTSTLQLGEDSSMLPQLAARQAGLLRAQMFPDALIQQQLMSRFRDTSLSAAERTVALSELLGAQRSSREPTAFDTGVIAAGAATMPANDRAQLWRSVRGTPGQELVEALTESVRLDPDLVVRYEALATLAADYLRESPARTAIESVAKEDPEQVMRMAARRALSGESEWRTYVIRLLKDTRLPLPDRLAPLLLAGRSATTPAETLELRRLVNDDEVANLLMGIVRDNWFDYTQSGSIGDALTLLADSGIPASSGLLVQIPRDNSRPGAATAQVASAPLVAAAPQISPAAMSWLQKNRDNPRVRRLLDDIARGNTGPQTSAIIEQMMQPRPMPRRQY